MNPAFGGAYGFAWQLFPQEPARHWPEQHSPSLRHAAPRRLHTGAAEPHVPWAPLQCPLQQSADRLQLAPSARHGAVHTVRPLGAMAHVPRQQALSCVHKEPTGRQGPEPKVHTRREPSQMPQQGPSAPPHRSPVARQTVLELSPSQTPFTAEQTDEQQSALVLHLVSSAPQIGAAHAPAWQPIEQQSSARVHGTPSGWQ